MHLIRIYYCIIARKCGGICLVLKPEIGFAYKCPSCGGARLHTFDIFKLSAGSKLCVCDCARSCMHLIFAEKDVSAELLCPYCGMVHTYRLSAAELLHNNLCELVCGETQLVCAYAGTPQRVEEAVGKYHTAMDTLAKELCELPDTDLAGEDRAEIDRILVRTGDGKLREADLVLSSICTVEEMLYDHRITCPCGSKKYELAFLEGYVQVKCGDCGAYVRLQAKNDRDLQKLMTSGEIQLTK